MVITQCLYSGECEREALLTLLRWAKLEGYESDIDVAYAETTGLMIESDYALDWMAREVPDYEYILETTEGFWALVRIAHDRSVVECG